MGIEQLILEVKLITFNLAEWFYNYVIPNKYRKIFMFLSS